MKKILLALMCIPFTVLCACGSLTTIEEAKSPIITSKKDPYSFVIKAYYSFEQNFEFYRDTLFDKEDELKRILARNFKMLPEYAFFNLWERMHYGASRNLQYAFYETDNQGTQALLLGADGALFDVYVIQNGIAVQQELFLGDQGPTMLFKTGTIRTVTGYDGPLLFSYYRFEDGVLKFQVDLYDDEGEYYRTDNKDGWQEKLISKEEFDRLQKEYEGDGQEVQLDWKPLAEYGKEE